MSLRDYLSIKLAVGTLINFVNAAESFTLTIPLSLEKLGGRVKSKRHTMLIGFQELLELRHH